MMVRRTLEWLVALLLTVASTAGYAQEEGSGAPAPEAAPAASAPAPAANDPSYGLRLRELEDRVNELKEDVFRSKSRLYLLREQILQDTIGGSRVSIEHRNEMSSSFRLVQVLYTLDGNQVFSSSADGSIAGVRTKSLMDDSVLPGPHNLAVQFVFEGDGYGLFSYMKGYRFTVRSSYAFHVEEGQTARIRVVVFERGGPNTSIEDRPDVRYEVEMLTTTEQSAPVSAAPSAGSRGGI